MKFYCYVDINCRLKLKWTEKSKQDKFISFRYHTNGYRQKKNLDDSVTVHADLTKKCHSLLRKADDLVTNKDEVLLLCGHKLSVKTKMDRQVKAG